MLQRLKCCAFTQKQSTPTAAVSGDVAAEMAEGALAQSQADIAVSITGIAGPGGSEHKSEGRVCFGLATPEATVTCTVDFGALGRGKVRKKAARFALRALRDKTLDQTPN